MSLADVRSFVADNGLTKRDDSRAVAHTAAVVALYVGVTSVGFLVDRWPVWVLVAVGQGLVLVGSYSAMHEAAHGMLFRAKGANRVAAWAWGTSILINSSLWRCFHLEHHARTATPEDPEARYKIQITRRSQYLLLPPGGLQFMVQFWWESLATLFGRYPAYVRQGADKRAIRLDASLLLVVTGGLVAAIMLRPLLLLELWGGAFLVTACVLLPGTAINEHYGCDEEGTALDTTRTVLSNRAFRFLVWNSNYHIEHHLIASVPYHKVHELHEYLAPEERFVARSYTAFHLEVLRGCGQRR